jgi:hypothetical protein
MSTSLLLGPGLIMAFLIGLCLVIYYPAVVEESRVEKARSLEWTS